MELPTARLNCDNSVDEMQLAAKDLVHPTKSDHILGNTSLQIKIIQSIIISQPRPSVTFGGELEYLLSCYTLGHFLIHAIYSYKKHAYNSLV